MKKPGYYSSGEFARMAHVTLRTIRYYDKQNILKPSYVTEAGARFYTDEDFARLQQILLLKYLGFSLDDIRDMTIDDADYHFMLNSLNIQLKLVRDRIEQMQLVEQAIQDTSDLIKKEHSIDWSQMLNLIHLTGMEKSMKNQYQDASNISARINLHSLYSQNKQGWFPWIFEQLELKPGMKVLEFAFDPREPSNYLPHKYGENCICYTGTHDNEPLLSYIEGLDETARRTFEEDLRRECGAAKVPVRAESASALCKTTIRLLFSGKSFAAVVPMNDLLCLGKVARINFPSTVSRENWSYRFKKSELGKRAAEWLKALAKKYQR